MKVLMMPYSNVRATPEERSALRPIGRSVERYQDLLEELEELAIGADEYGIDAFGLTEHHLSSEGGEAMPNSLMLFSKLAAKTRQIKFMPASVVLPVRDPIRTAEDIALFDNMYPGRIAVSFARGYQIRWLQTLSQQEHIISGPTDPEGNAKNREIYNEYLDVIVKAWTEDSFNFAGKHYQAPYPATGTANWPAPDWTRQFGTKDEVDAEGTLHNIAVVPKPVTQPHPQIWVPYTMSYETLVQAARRRFFIFVYEGRTEQFRKVCGDYQAEAGKAGLDLRLGEGIGALRKIFLGNTYEEAFDLAVRSAGFWFNRYFSNFGLNEVHRLPSDDPNRLVSFSSDEECAQRMIDTGQCLCGTPDDVTRQLEDLRRCHSDGDLEWLVWEFCGTDKESDKRQLDMFASKVLPRIR